MLKRLFIITGCIVLAVRINDSKDLFQAHADIKKRRKECKSLSAEQIQKQCQPLKAKLK